MEVISVVHNCKVARIVMEEEADYTTCDACGAILDMCMGVQGRDTRYGPATCVEIKPYVEVCKTDPPTDSGHTETTLYHICPDCLDKFLNGAIKKDVDAGSKLSYSIHEGHVIEKEISLIVQREKEMERLKWQEEHERQKLEGPLRWLERPVY